MVVVPAGEFAMGSPDGDADELPVHTVALGGFYIDRTEVTNAQFGRFLTEQGNQTEEGTTWLDLEAEDCLIEQRGEDFEPRTGYDEHPVIEVSWHGAVAYCKWAGARLPTEAEWEYAARGPERRTYPWGTGEPDCDKANHTPIEQIEGCAKSFVAVGSYPAGRSWCGALDLSGNASEWVADWYSRYSPGPQRDPRGPDSGDKRVVRGGYWHSEPFRIRSAARSALGPRLASPAIGFRCATDPG
jgi:formylglycine-generating enzyme required for sulfatase activity